jgi:hypothetical protein
MIFDMVFTSQKFVVEGSVRMAEAEYRCKSLWNEMWRSREMREVNVFLK